MLYKARQKYTRTCERGGMADTAVLEAAAERRGGSSPFVRTKNKSGRFFGPRFLKGNVLPLKNGAGKAQKQL